MNAKMIVILMMVVLVCLFIWSRKYRRKEESINGLEIASFEALNNFANNKTEENKAKAIEASKALAMAHGMNEQSAQEKAAQEIQKFS